MHLYSKKIIQFIQEIKNQIKDILSREIHLKTSGDYFFDRSGKNAYPIKIVVYNHKSMLGYFDSEFLELGFHENLMHCGKDKLGEIIRHELAHYITFINYGPTVAAHGVEFRAFCQRMGWNENVYRATTCLDDGVTPQFMEASSVLRKVQKLMALATSSNENEAEQAMIKSQQLLLKHNIDEKYVDDEEKIFLKRVLKQKKENAKMRAIARILQTFFVNTVYTRSSGHIYLEITGNAVNIAIAEYVADYLQRELDTLWETNRKKHAHLKGLVAKNSFFLGIARGYCNKIDAIKKEYSEEVSLALMVIEKKLTSANSMIYSKLRAMTSYGQQCRQSSSLGEQLGKNLTINTALKNNPGQSRLFLSTIP